MARHRFPSLERIGRQSSREAETPPAAAASSSGGALHQPQPALQKQLAQAGRLKERFEQKAGRLARPAEFALVGLSGMVVDLAAFTVLGLWISLGIARALAIWLAMTWNYALNRRVTFAACRQDNPWRAYVLFCGSCLAGALVSWSVCMALCVASAWFLRYFPVAALIGVVAGFVLNYLLSCRFVFRPGGVRTEAEHAVDPKVGEGEPPASRNCTADPWQENGGARADLPGGVRK